MNNLNLFNRNRRGTHQEDEAVEDNAQLEMMNDEDFKQLPHEVQCLVISAYEKTVETGLLVPRVGLLKLQSFKSGTIGNNNNNNENIRFHKLSWIQEIGTIPSSHSPEIAALEWGSHVERFGNTLKWCDYYKLKELSNIDDNSFLKQESLIISTSKQILHGIRIVASGETFTSAEPSYSAARARLIECNTRQRRCKEEVESLMAIASIHCTTENQKQLFSTQHELVDSYMMELGTLKANFNAARSARSSLINMSENLAKLCPNSQNIMNQIEQNEKIIYDSIHKEEEEKKHLNPTDQLKHQKNITPTNDFNESPEEALLTMLLDLPINTSSSASSSFHGTSKGGGGRRTTRRHPSSSFNPLGNHSTNNSSSSSSPMSDDWHQLSPSSSSSSSIDPMQRGPKTAFTMLQDSDRLMLPHLQIFVDYVDGNMGCLEELLSHGEWRCEEDMRRLSAKKGELESNLEMEIVVGLSEWATKAKQSQITRLKEAYWGGPDGLRAQAKLNRDARLEDWEKIKTALESSNRLEFDDAVRGSFQHELNMLSQDQTRASERMNQINVAMKAHEESSAAAISSHDYQLTQCKIARQCIHTRNERLQQTAHVYSTARVCVHAIRTTNSWMWRRLAETMLIADEKLLHKMRACLVGFMKTTAKLLDLLELILSRKRLEMEKLNNIQKEMFSSDSESLRDTMAQLCDKREETRQLREKCRLEINELEEIKQRCLFGVASRAPLLQQAYYLLLQSKKRKAQRIKQQQFFSSISEDLKDTQTEQLDFLDTVPSPPMTSPSVSSSNKTKAEEEDKNQNINNGNLKEFSPLAKSLNEFCDTPNSTEMFDRTSTSFVNAITLAVNMLLTSENTEAHHKLAEQLYNDMKNKFDVKLKVSSSQFIEDNDKEEGAKHENNIQPMKEESMNSEPNSELFSILKSDNNTSASSFSSSSTSSSSSSPYPDLQNNDSELFMHNTPRADSTDLMSFQIVTPREGPEKDEILKEDSGNNPGTTCQDIDDIMDLDDDILLFNTKDYVRSSQDPDPFAHLPSFPEGQEDMFRSSSNVVQQFNHQKHAQHPAQTGHGGGGGIALVAANVVSAAAGAVAAVEEEIGNKRFSLPNFKSMFAPSQQNNPDKRLSISGVGRRKNSEMDTSDLFHAHNQRKLQSEQEQLKQEIEQDLSEKKKRIVPVQVPEGAKEGQGMSVVLEGVRYKFRVPNGMKPGGIIQLDLDEASQHMPRRSSDMPQPVKSPRGSSSQPPSATAPPTSTTPFQPSSVTQDNQPSNGETTLPSGSPNDMNSDAQGLDLLASYLMDCEVDFAQAIASAEALVKANIRSLDTLRTTDVGTLSVVTRLSDEDLCNVLNHKIKTNVLGDLARFRKQQLQQSTFQNEGNNNQARLEQQQERINFQVQQEQENGRLQEQIQLIQEHELIQQQQHMQEPTQQIDLLGPISEGNELSTMPPYQNDFMMMTTPTTVTTPSYGVGEDQEDGEVPLDRGSRASKKIFDRQEL